jgi:hypothetical protein
MQHSNEDTVSLSSEAAEREAAGGYIAHRIDSVHGKNVLVRGTIGEACDAVAAHAWGAVCNGEGRVDSKTRKIFDAARDLARSDDFGGSVVDGIAHLLEKRTSRHIKRITVLRVDGVTFTVKADA